MSKVKLGLRNVADWVSTISSAAGDTVEFAVESGFLQDTLSEICSRGGVAGAVFKLGAMAIPTDKLEADAETRIGAQLTRAFIASLDGRLKAAEDHIDLDQWKRYQKEQLEHAAKAALNAEFTWTKVIGRAGRKSSRSWPIVHEFADLARRIVWEAATLDADTPEQNVQQFADDVRGIVLEDLCACIDKLNKDPFIERAFQIESPAIARDSLKRLAERFSTIDDAHLFDEIPQKALFISPTIRIADYSETEVQEDWSKIDAVEDGDCVLAGLIQAAVGTPKVFVVTGEMGVGKSCLLRSLTAQLSKNYLSDKADGVVFANWRDIYESSNLIDGIAQHIDHQYGLQLPDLKNEERLILLIDGFDEMRSHDPSVVQRYFESLVKLANDHNSPLVLAMRSTITDGMSRPWKDHDVVVTKVDEFSDEDVDGWAEKWCQHRDVGDVTGDGLRQLCGNLEELTRNPLLLFMLTRFVRPTVNAGETLSRTQIFRTFVNETIAGKARQSGERSGISVNVDNYRFLLQEIAWIASWPNHGGKCPLKIVKDRCSNSVKDDFSLEDARSAFVLHFFEPGDQANEFEFHPEGFRHYLLAEWCLRTQCEVLLFDEMSSPSYPTGRKREEAMMALAQFPLREVERDLMNEIYEDLHPTLSADPVGERDTPESRIRELGLPPECTSQILAADLPRKLFDRLQHYTSEPPTLSGTPDTQVGIPDGHVTIKSMQSARHLTAYWDHCFLAVFALFRGMKLAQEPTLHASESLARFLGIMQSSQQASSFPFNASHSNLHVVNLVGSFAFAANLRRANLRRASLSFANLNDANLSAANLSGAELSQADLSGANLSRANLSGANLRRADLSGAVLSGANLSGANLSGADLSRANLSEAILSGAILNWAILSRADLSEANLSEANLSEAELNHADLSDANLSGATLNDSILSETQKKSIRKMPDGKPYRPTDKS